MLGYVSIVESSFAIVAEPNRRAILSLLLSSERSVGEIERELRLSQPSVSKHLRVLREAGFVESRIEAQRRLYRLSRSRSWSSTHGSFPSGASAQSTSMPWSNTWKRWRSYPL